MDSSWAIYNTIKGDKATVLTILNNDINALQGKNWGVDYAGNGTILAARAAAKDLLPLATPITQNKIGQDNV